MAITLPQDCAEIPL